MHIAAADDEDDSYAETENDTVPSLQTGVPKVSRPGSGLWLPAFTQAG